MYGVIWVHVFKLGTIGKTQCKLPVKPAWTTEYLLSYMPNLDVRYVSNIMYESGYIRTFNGIWQYKVELELDSSNLVSLEIQEQSCCNYDVITTGS